MDVIDYNGEGRWTREATLDRCSRHAAELGVVPRDLSPLEHTERDRRWVYPVMSKVIEGIKAGDAACIRLGIEFIEEDAKFPVGRFSSRTRLARFAAPRLRRSSADASAGGCSPCCERDISPNEFQEYARLVKKIGFEPAELGDVPGTSDRVSRFRSYLQAAARPGN